MKALRRIGGTAAAAGLAIACLFVVPTTASATTTAKVNGCYTTWYADYGNAYCSPATVKAYVYASGTCSWYPGVRGATSLVYANSVTGAFSHIACSTSLTAAYINVTAA